jgi:magnesium chelatase subunit D
VLVVISDGRGNVPLEASHLGRIKTPVGRQGVDDVLQVSEQIHGLNRVESVILNPQPKQYPELPLLLAQKIGAKVVLIPSLETWEAEETWEVEE